MCCYQRVRVCLMASQKETMRMKESERKNRQTRHAIRRNAIVVSLSISLFVAFNHLQYTHTHLRPFINFLFPLKIAAFFWSFFSLAIDVNGSEFEPFLYLKGRRKKNENSSWVGERDKLRVLQPTRRVMCVRVSVMGTSVYTMWIRECEWVRDSDCVPMITESLWNGEKSS